MAGAFQSDAFQTDAFESPSGGSTVSSSFTANAIIRRSQSSSLTADAVVKRAQAASLTANAVTLRSASGTFTANATARVVVSGGYTADVVIKAAIGGAFTADAVILAVGGHTGYIYLLESGSPDGYRLEDDSGVLLLDNTIFGSFTIDAWLRAIQSASLTADAVILRAGITGSFTADAVVMKTTSSSVSADADLKKTIASSLTADSVVQRASSGSFTANATLLRTSSPTATANAVLKRTQLPTFTADAVTRKSASSSFTADAVTSLGGATVSGSFTANAVKLQTVDQWFTAFDVNAVLISQEKDFSLTADAVIFRAGITGSFTAQAAITRFTTGGTGGSGGGTGAIGGGGGPANAGAWSGGGDNTQPIDVIPVIKLDGVDITDDVRIATASFISQVNGTPGTCSIEIKDLGHTYGPISGKSLTLDLNGIRYWTGFAMKISRIYAFAVDVTTTPTITERYFRIDGVDLNILFAKRVAYNKANPERGDLPAPAGHQCGSAGVTKDSWAEDSPVEFVVPYLLNNYTDLPADGITFDVAAFGTPNPDLCAGFSGAVNVGALMHDLNRNLQGVFYIRPDSTMVYHDADTITSPYYLTDRPELLADSYAIAARDYSFMSDGGAMVNDALVWGAAQGYAGITFSRATDNVDSAAGISSVTDHGLWQFADFSQQMFRQASVDRRAHSIVYGVTQSQKGARWDRAFVTATVFDPVFMPGDVVNIISSVYDDLQREPFEAQAGNAIAFGPLAIALPIRRMEITFPTPTSAKFQLTLTREIDEPWNIFEQLWTMPAWHFPRIDIDVPPPVLPPPEPEPCTDCLFDFGNQYLGGFSEYENYNTVVSGSGPSFTIIGGPGSPTGSNLRLARLFDWNVGSSQPTTIRTTFVVPTLGGASDGMTFVVGGSPELTSGGSRGAGITWTGTPSGRLWVFAGYIASGGGFAITDHGFFDGVNAGDRFYLDLTYSPGIDQYDVKCWKVGVPETGGTYSLGVPYDPNTQVLKCSSFWSRSPGSGFDKDNIAVLSLETQTYSPANSLEWNILSIEVIGAADCAQLCGICTHPTNFERPGHGGWLVINMAGEQFMSNFPAPLLEYGAGWLYASGAISQYNSQLMEYRAPGSAQAWVTSPSFSSADQELFARGGRFSFPFSFSFEAVEHVFGNYEPYLLAEVFIAFVPVQGGMTQTIDILVIRGGSEAVAWTPPFVAITGVAEAPPGTIPIGDAVGGTIDFSVTPDGHWALSVGAAFAEGDDLNLANAVAVSVGQRVYCRMDPGGSVPIPVKPFASRMSPFTFHPADGSTPYYCTPDPPFPYGTPGMEYGLHVDLSGILNLKSAFQSGTSKVYLNGILQRPGIDYIEDPATGRIIFLDPKPTPADNVDAGYVPVPPAGNSGGGSGYTPPPPSGAGILIDPAVLMALPTSGAAWNSVLSWANKGDNYTLASQDSNGNIACLARALVAARTGNKTYRDAVLNDLRYVQTTVPDRTLALGRELGIAPIAAELIGATYAELPNFSSWLSTIISDTFAGEFSGNTLLGTAMDRPNNWGCHAMGALSASYVYLGMTTELADLAAAFKGWLGDRGSYAGFSYGDTSWQSSPSLPVGINPAGATISGHNVDGVLPDDQRRAGGFSWPPPKENYVWEALQGAVMAAHIFTRAGYDMWSESDLAIKRALIWLHDVDGFPAQSDDTWVPWLVNYAYGTSFPAPSPSSPGKNLGFTDWLFG